MDTLKGDLGRYFCAWELWRNEKDSIIEADLEFRDSFNKKSSTMMGEIL